MKILRLLLISLALLSQPALAADDDDEILLPSQEGKRSLSNEDPNKSKKNINTNLWDLTKVKNSKTLIIFPCIFENAFELSMYVLSEYSDITNIQKIVFAGGFNDDITVEDISSFLSQFTKLNEVKFDTDCVFYHPCNYYLNQNDDNKTEKFTLLHNKTKDDHQMLKKEKCLNIIKAISSHLGVQKFNFYSYLLDDTTMVEISKIKNLINLHIDLYTNEDTDTISASTQVLLIKEKGGNALSQMNLKTLRINYPAIFSDELTDAEHLDILKYISKINTLETLCFVDTFETSEFIFAGEENSDTILKILHKMKNLKNLILEARDHDNPILRDFIFQLDKMHGLKNLIIDGAYLSHGAIAKIKDLEKTNTINFLLKNIRTKHPHPGNRLCFFEDWTSATQIESDLFLKATLHGIQNFNLEKTWVNKWSRGFAKTINDTQNQIEENNINF
jgi:hypothetical protein